MQKQIVFFDGKRVAKKNKYVYTNKEGSTQIATNIILRSSSVKTISYSQFIGGTYQIDDKRTGFDSRNILWAFLNSDEFIVNNEAMKSSLNKHPNSIKHISVSGNIFDQLIRESMAVSSRLHDSGNKKHIVFFDTSYVDIESVYSSYEEAIEYLLHVIKITQELPDNQYYFKPSKDAMSLIRAWPKTDETSKIKAIITFNLFNRLFIFFFIIRIFLYI